MYAVWMGAIGWTGSYLEKRLHDSLACPLPHPSSSLKTSMGVPAPTLVHHT